MALRSHKELYRPDYLLLHQVQLKREEKRSLLHFHLAGQQWQHSKSRFSPDSPEVHEKASQNL